MNKEMKLTKEESVKYEHLTNEMKVYKDYINKVMDDIINDTNVFSGMKSIDQRKDFILYCLGEIINKYLKSREEILPNLNPPALRVRARLRGKVR